MVVPLYSRPRKVGVEDYCREVRQALALLEEAGRMDLVQPEALGRLRPACRHLQGLRRRLWRTGQSASQVRRAGRAKGGYGGKGTAWAGRGTDKVGPVWGGPNGNPRRAERSRHQLVDRAWCSAMSRVWPARRARKALGEGEGPEQLGAGKTSLLAITEWCRSR
ncbi:hypothetical protein NDU88_000114 [Pleurodeles waltl]|uniref:Uncharacterized protein n=1 Tax=Pleurodeles waltl TaxID=8319 RepID=A0AAV7VV40_PLEWA|nr:hypothetical protein NDU88_000114 [Pleurodeles waltl]